MVTVEAREENSIACESCGSSRFSIIGERWDGSKIVRCQACALEFVDPLPSEEDLKRICEEDMLNHGAQDSLLQNYIAERKERSKSYNKLYASRLGLIEKKLGRRGRLLDIGCAAGFFIKAAEARGWEVSGMDIIPEYIDFARRELQLKDVHLGALEGEKLPENSFDAVTLWDLIEHLRHPAETLREINRILRPGGLLVIWTPNAKNAVFQKANWYGYRIRLHLYFFSSRSLAALLGRSGFQLIYERTDKAKKGLFPMTAPKPYERPLIPASRFQKIKHGLKRDLKNFMNPVNYLSPMLDRLGFGFNLFIIARKDREIHI